MEPRSITERENQIKTGERQRVLIRQRASRHRSRSAGVQHPLPPRSQLWPHCPCFPPKLQSYNCLSSTHTHTHTHWSRQLCLHSVGLWERHADLSTDTQTPRKATGHSTWSIADHVDCFFFFFSQKSVYFWMDTLRIRTRTDRFAQRIKTENYFWMAESPLSVPHGQYLCGRVVFPSLSPHRDFFLLFFSRRNLKS